MEDACVLAKFASGVPLHAVCSVLYMSSGVVIFWWEVSGFIISLVLGGECEKVVHI